MEANQKMWIKTNSDTERLYDAEIMGGDPTSDDPDDYDDPEGKREWDRSGVEFNENGKAQVTKEVGEQLIEKNEAITAAGDDE